MRILNLSLIAIALSSVCACNILNIADTSSQKPQNNAVVIDATASNQKADKKKTVIVDDTKTTSVKTRKGNPEILRASDVNKALEEGTALALENSSTSILDEGNIEDFSRPESEGASLPNYASGSQEALNSCDLTLGNNAQTAAISLTNAMLKRLKVDAGAVYVAPTVIPDKYLDCIFDISFSIKQTLQGSDLFTVATQDKESSITKSSQNTGNASAIPVYVRGCRQADIPYLIVTIIRDIGTTPALTVRLIRVHDGITLSQSYQKIN